MPHFAYQALTESGGVTSGSMPAATEDELERLLRERGQYLIRAELSATAQGDAASLSAAQPSFTDGSVSRRDLLAFTEYLAGGIHAGLPILTLLNDVELHLQSRQLRKIVRELADSIGEEGRSLSESLAQHPKTFSRLFIGAVQAGEASGQLDYVLSQLVAYLDWQENIATQVRQAVMYPLIVLFAVALLVLAIIMFVYPRLLPVLAGFDVELPLPTRVFMGISATLSAHGIKIFAAIAAAVAAVWLYLRTERGQWTRDRLVLQLPAVGRFVSEVNMARFVTYLALFYRAGVELIHGLTIIEEMMPNRVIGKAVQQARIDITGGSSIAAAFQRTGRFPVIVLRSLALGESTGSLDDALQRAKSYYDRELPAAVRRLLTGLQPMLVVLLGLVVVGVGLSIFMPILSIYRSVGP